MGEPAAFAFALLGACDDVQQASTLASAILLSHTRPSYPTVAVLSPSCRGRLALLDRLRKLNVRPIHLGQDGDMPSVGAVKCSGRTRFGGAPFAHTYDKFSIWNLTAWRSILYIDSDVSVLRNMDHVLQAMLDRPTMGHAITTEGCSNFSANIHEDPLVPIEGHKLARHINTGVWAVRPSGNVYSSLLNFLGTTRLPCDLGDQVRVGGVTWPCTWPLSGVGGARDAH